MIKAGGVTGKKLWCKCWDLGSEISRFWSLKPSGSAPPAGPQGGGSDRLVAQHIALSQRTQRAGSGPGRGAGDGGPDGPGGELHPRAAVL